MKNMTRPLEAVFLENTLRVSLFGMVFIVLADFYPSGLQLNMSTIIDLSIFACMLVSMILFKRGHFQFSVCLLALVILITMNYQSVVAANTTNVSMAVVEVVGFIISLSLKGILKKVMHGIAVMGILIVTAFQVSNPEFYLRLNEVEVVTYSVTYLILYVILTYTTGLLKTRYDEALITLAQKNHELSEKSNEIETQNEELMQSQENLYSLNQHLEEKVWERTQKIAEQNELLLQYSYSNAHHVRGPLARILGLIYLVKRDKTMDTAFVIDKIEEQANEIDNVVKEINRVINQTDFFSEAGAS